jgi:hypothetical protein
LGAAEKLAMRSKENDPAKKNCTQREEAPVGQTFASRLEEVEKEQVGEDGWRENFRSS